MKAHQNMNLKELRDYVRANKLNKAKVRLGMNKSEMISALKKIDHWEEQPKVKKTNTKSQSKGVLQVGKKPDKPQRIDTSNKNKGKVLKSEPPKVLSDLVNNNLKKRIKIINDYLSGKITEDKREELENDISPFIDADMKKVVSPEFLESNGTIKLKYFKELQDPSLVKELKSILNKKPKKEAPKKEAPKKEAPKKSPPPIRFSGSAKKIASIKRKKKKKNITLTEGLKLWKDDIEAYERRMKPSLKSLINKGYTEAGLTKSLKELEQEGIKVFKKV